MCLKLATNELLNDQYVKQWLTGLSERTKANYVKEFEKWVSFVSMNPTEQIKTRIENLTSKDLAQRHFFENKFREYKALLESQGKLSPISVKTALICVASFFGSLCVCAVCVRP